MKQFYKFRPYGHEFGINKDRSDKSFSRQKGNPSYKGYQFPRIHYSTMAFSTSINSSDLDWAEKEMQRVRELLFKEGVPYEYLDMIAVLDKGYLLPAPGLVVVNNQESNALSGWYFALLSFLARESSRRSRFPWDDYQPRFKKESLLTVEKKFSSKSPKYYSNRSRNKYRS